MESNSKFILGYRIFFALLSLITMLAGYLIGLLENNSSLVDIISSFRFFTNQSNILVLAWLLLAIYFNSNPEKMNGLMGSLKGAITSYITVTFVVFAILLAHLYTPPTPFATFSNLVVHYIMPVAFIIDFFLTESKNYEWKWIPSWFIYPIVYIIFAVLHGLIVESGFEYASSVVENPYIYPFFDLTSLELTGLVFSVLGLSIFYFVLCVFYIGSTKVKAKYISN